MKEFTLNNGIGMPVIGLGTYPMNGSILIETILKAIKNGYSSFDTASAYTNQEAMGEALKLCNKRREEIFITSKLSNSEQRNRNVEESLKRTLKILNIQYIDLYLIHWPNPQTYLSSWIQLERLYKQGLVKAIGVCNFHENHLAELLNICNVVPTINQIEVHPFLTQKPLIKSCKNYNIQVEAYSPLARMHEKIINNSLLLKLANKYDKTIPQIVLRWNYQNGIISIPKTENVKRLMENINIFDFNMSFEELEKINSINENFRVRHNPDNCDFTKL